MVHDPVNNLLGFGKSIATRRPFCQIGETEEPTAGRGATVTTRYERIKEQRRMQRRIRLVVEERRMAVALSPHDRALENEATMEIRPRAIGRVSLPTI
jgi:hypothetical protein